MVDGRPAAGSLTAMHKISGVLYEQEARAVIQHERGNAARIAWRAVAAGVCLLLIQPAAGLALQHQSARAGAPPEKRNESERITENERTSMDAQKRKVVFVAGRRSHGYGSHEHHAGSLLLSRLLNENHPQVETVVHENGWPSDPDAFDDAAAIVIFADGGRGHPAVQHLDELGALMDRGVGLVLLHYGVEVEKETAGEQFLDWVGGYFETHWSVNPHWTMKSLGFPDHPVTRGMLRYEINDEWYYHMRFRDGMSGVQPILSALPPASSLEREDGPHSGNPHVRAAVLERNEPQHLAWAVERDDGGRGFGFTGAHWHWNWGHPMQRKLVLNAISWAAGANVPKEGVDPGVVTMEDLEQNQDFTPDERFDRERWMRLVEQWQREFPREK